MPRSGHLTTQAALERGRVRVVAFLNPLSTERVFADVPAGSSLLSIVEQLVPEDVRARAFVSVNTESASDLSRVTQAGDVVAVRVTPGYGLLEALVYALISLAVSYIVQAIIGEPGKPDEIDRTPSATVKQVGNQFLPDAPLWRVFGKTRLAPPHAAVTLIRQRGTEPTTRALLFVTMGDAIVSQIRFGETDRALLPSEASVLRNQTAINFPTVEQLYPNIKLEDRIGGSPAFVQTLSQRATRLELEFEFPGLARYSEKGNKRFHAVDLQIEYREVGAGSWLSFGSGAALETWGSATSAKTITSGRVTVIGKTTSACGVRVTRELGAPAKQYELRAQLLVSSEVFDTGSISPSDYTKERGGTGSNVSTLFTDPTWVRLTGFVPEPAIKGFSPGCTVIDVTAVGETSNTDSSGNVNCVASARVPILSGGARGAVQETSNPAAIALFYLTSHNGTGVTYEVRNPIPDAQIDFASFQTFYDYCAELVPTINGGTEPRHQCDGVFDQDGLSMWDVVSQILGTGRATLDRIDGKYAVVVNRKRSAPTLILTDAEITAARSTRSWPIRPHALRCTFRNEALDYKTDERVVYDDLYADDSGSVSALSLTYSVPAAGRKTLTRASGDFDSDLVATEGFVRVQVGAVDAYFLIDNVSATVLTLHDPSALLPTSGSASTTITATAAQRYERRVFQLTQRASEVWREGRFQLALAKLRAEAYEIDCGIEWLGVQRGEMVEVSTEVFNWGASRAVLLEFTPPGDAISELRVDETWSFDDLGDPAVRLGGVSAAGNFVAVESRVDVAGTATLRAAKASDQWVKLVSAIDGSSWIQAGAARGVAVVLGEYQLQTQELVVEAIQKKRSEIAQGNFDGKLICRDHAPELFDVIDLQPVPNFTSLLGRRRSTFANTGAPPGRPEITAVRLEVITGVASIAAAAPNQFTRATGSFVSDGFQVGMRVRASGFTNAANNALHAEITAVTASALTITGATLVTEAASGDEQLIGAFRTGPATVDVDSYGTGLAQLSVTPQGAGVVHIDGPVGEALFASFRAAGYVACETGFRDENRGVFPITALRNGGDGITITNAAGVTEVASARFVRQSQLHRASGSFLAAGMASDTYVSATGFARSNTTTPFRVALATAAYLVLDDPAAELFAELGSGDEEIYLSSPRIRAEIAQPLGDTDDVAVTYYLAIAPNPSGGNAERYEVAWRAYPLGSDATQFDHIETIGGQSVEVRIGPLPIDDDWDAQVRAIGADRQRSEPASVTRVASVGLAGAPTNLTVAPQSTGTIQLGSQVVRIAWQAPTAAPLGSSYFVQVRKAGEPQRIAKVSGLSWDFTPTSLGSYDITVRLVDPFGRPGTPATTQWSYELTVPTIGPYFPSFEGGIGNPFGSFGSFLFVGAGGIPSSTWSTPDLHMMLIEPALSIQTDLGSEPSAGEGGGAGADADVDAAVQEFEIEVFDPDTNKILRTLKQRSRELRYTPAMQYEDQQRVFGRGLQKKLGVRAKAKLKSGKVLPLKSVVAEKQGDPGHSNALMKPNAFSNMSEAITASPLRVFDFNTAEADIWKTILRQTLTVEGQPNSANGRSTIVVGGFFQGCIDAGVYGASGQQRPAHLHSQFQYRIVRNPVVANAGADGEGEVFVLDPLHITAGGYFFAPHISVLDLQPAGVYSYELQVIYSRSKGYREGTARFGGLSGSNRIVLGTGTRWRRSGLLGDHSAGAADPLLELRIPGSAVNTNWNPILQVDSDTQLLLEGDPIGSSEATSFAYETRIDNAEDADWPLGLLISPNSALWVREDK
jgi:hypothetical protein